MPICIPRRDEWTRQPQIVTRPASRYGMVYLCNHAICPSGVFNLADGVLASYSSFNGEKQGVGTRGLGPKPTGQTLATISKGLGGDFVLVALISDWTTGATAQSILDDDDGANRAYQFRVYNDKVDLIRFNTSGSAFTCSSATLTAAQRGAGIGVVARSFGTALDVWVDGVRTSATLTGTPKATNTTFAVLGRKGATQPFLGRCYETGAAPGVWGDETCHAVSVNTWRVMES